MHSDVRGLVQILDVVGRKLPDTFTDRLVEGQEDVYCQNHKAKHDKNGENDRLGWYERVVGVMEDTDFQLEDRERF